MSVHIKILEKGKTLPTVISFSSVNTPPGRFKPYRIVEEANANIIFVNDHLNRWYQDGITGIADDAEAAAKYLTKLARGIGDGRVVTFGTSMGAYGAMLYAALGEADGCLAFGVESVLGMDGSRSQRYMTKPINNYDLREKLLGSNVPIYLYSSECDEVDLISAYRLRDVNCVRNITVKGIEHPSVQVFDLDGSITDMISYFAHFGESIKDFDRKGDILEEDSVLIKELYECYKLKINNNVDSWLSRTMELSRKYSKVPLIFLRLGEAYHKKGNALEAEAAWRRAIELCQYQFEAHAKLGALLRRKKELDEAEYHLKRSIEINPYHPYSFHSLGLLYLDKGNYQLAETNLRKATSLNRGNRDFKKSLAKCLIEESKVKMEEANKILSEI